MHPHWKPLRRLCSWSGYRLGSTCRNTRTLVTNAKRLLPASGCSHRQQVLLEHWQISTGLREGMSQKIVTFSGSENLKSQDSTRDRPFLLRFLNRHVIKAKGETSIL